MKKTELRKEFLKLRIKGHSYNQCKKLLKTFFESEISTRTLKRWEKKNKTDLNWDLTDKSRKPKTINYFVSDDKKQEIIKFRNKTGFGEKKIASYFNLSHTTINKILAKNNLLLRKEGRKKRIKYIRWQRKHPNSLWQMDTSDQKIEGRYCFAILDDCSRYCLGVFALNTLSTKVIVNILDNVFKVHGKPREILTDNGSVFGLKSKHSQFDRALNRRGIKHIRTAVHSPTTSGKIERFFQTIDREFAFCKKDAELFRMRYNHFRPHQSLENKSPAEIYFNFSKLF